MIWTLLRPVIGLLTLGLVLAMTADIVAEGTPADIVKSKWSKTTPYLAKHL
jgi:hypothetical protein